MAEKRAVSVLRLKKMIAERRRKELTLTYTTRTHPTGMAKNQIWILILNLPLLRADTEAYDTGSFVLYTKAGNTVAGELA